MKTNVADSERSPGRHTACAQKHCLNSPGLGHTRLASSTVETRLATQRKPTSMAPATSSSSRWPSQVSAELVTRTSKVTSLSHQAAAVGLRSNSPLRTVSSRNSWRWLRAVTRPVSGESTSGPVCCTRAL
ncbi:hypothetical protein MRX96_035364 [Rhipicephalus microplus]